MKTHLPPIHLACQDDEMRPNFRFIEIKKGIAHATNGNFLVKMELEKVSDLTNEQIELLNGKYIHMEAWKEIHKADIIEFTEDGFSCWNKGIKKVYEYGEPVGEFFTIDSVIVGIKSKGEVEVGRIAYNPKMIATIAKIFESNTLFFSFSGPSSGTVVYPSYDCGMFAILMPCMLDAESSSRYLFLT